MSTVTLYRLSAVAAIIAGICIIVGSLLSNLLKSNKGTAFNFAAFLAGLFAVTGIYLRQRVESGVFGGIAYIIVFIGLALLMCVDYYGMLLAPSLSKEQIIALRSTPVGIAGMVSGLTFLVGDILFGISVIRAGIFSKIAAVLFMIGFLPTSFRETYPGLVFFGSLLSGAGIIWWGLTLWSS